MSVDLQTLTAYEAAVSDCPNDTTHLRLVLVNTLTIKSL